MWAKIERRPGEDFTGFTIRLIKAEIIERELEDLAASYEGAGPDALWTGKEIADHLRERIKNHPALTNGHQGGEA